MKQGITQKELLKQAKEAADGYICEAYGGKHRYIKVIGVILASLILTAATLVTVHFMF